MKRIDRDVLLALCLALATPVAAQPTPPAASAPASSGPAAARPVHEDAAVIAATREYQRSGQARVLRVGSYLVYPYGHTQPRLTCAPLRACNIQLEEGERPPAGASKFEPYTGDLERWFVGTTPGPRNTTLVVVQPSDCNLTTNLTIPTEKRLYQLTLDSPPCTARDTAGQNPDLPYDRIVRFYYPEELLQRLAADEDAQAQANRAEIERQVPVAAAPFDPTSLDFGYYLCRDRGYPWTPDQVFADREHTYVKLPQGGEQFETPALFEVGPAGELVLVNYAVRGGFYVVDRVLQRGVLVVGTGREGHEQRLLITRNRKDCPP
jgi:P-type conjugative transfer protein TrbG